MNRLLLAVAVVLLLPGSLDAATWTVKPDGTGDFPTIQAAVNAAVNNDIILLTDGTFSGAGNRNVAYLGKAITIQSVNGAGATTINCGGQNGFLFNNLETTASVLRDVTITSAGVAVYSHRGSPSIYQCTITASSTGVESGVYLFEDPAPSSPVVSFCTILGCGDALRTLEFGDINVSNTTISNCTFGGYSGTLGGFITATNCTFTSNGYAAGWGVGSLAGGSFTNCTFTGHAQAAVSTGGAQFVSLTNCRFENNHPAIYCQNYGVNVSGCTFVNNSSPASNPNGGAISADANNSLITIRNSVFCQNTASGRGGAIYSEMNIHIRGNTFVNNSSGLGAGALHLSGIYATGEVEQNIIAFSAQGPGLLCASGASPALECNDVYGNAGGDALCGTDGGNNISLDPLLCSSDCSDVGLAEGSPCAPANSPCGLQIGARPVTCAPVPVLFQSVTARAVDNGVQIAWSVEADEGIASFSVLRDGRVVGELPGVSDGIFVDTGVKPGSSYLYAVIATTTDGDVFQSQVVEVRTLSAELVLSQNQPNPFNPSTRIAFTLPEAGLVDVTVFDVNGKHVATILNATRPAGRSLVEWAGRDDRGQAVGSGIYFCRLTANGAVKTIKMVLMK